MLRLVVGPKSCFSSFRHFTQRPAREQDLLAQLARFVRVDQTTIAAEHVVLLILPGQWKERKGNIRVRVMLYPGTSGSLTSISNVTRRQTATPTDIRGGSPESRLTASSTRLIIACGHHFHFAVYVVSASLHSSAGLSQSIRSEAELIIRPLLYLSSLSYVALRCAYEPSITLNSYMVTGHWPQDTPGDRSTLHHAAWHLGSLL